MTAAVFLDRDNTLIHNDGDLGDPEQVRLIKGAATAIASLCGLGYRVFVVTNQGGVARGKYTEDDVKAVHERLHDMVRAQANGARIDGFYYCPFHPEGSVPEYTREHEDRKPQPGMLTRAAAEHGLELNASWMVGDALRDAQAGHAAGCRTILIDPKAQPVEKPRPGDGSERGGVPDFVAPGLIDAVRIIAQQRAPEPGDLANPKPGEARRWDKRTVAQLQRPDDPNPNDPDSSEPNPKDPDARDAAPGRRATRPFRPWNAPPPPEEQEATLRFARNLRRRRTAGPADPAADPQAHPSSITDPTAQAADVIGAEPFDAAGPAVEPGLPVEPIFTQAIEAQALEAQGIQAQGIEARAFDAQALDAQAQIDPQLTAGVEVDPTPPLPLKANDFDPATNPTEPTTVESLPTEPTDPRPTPAHASVSDPTPSGPARRRRMANEVSDPVTQALTARSAPPPTDPEATPPTPTPPAPGQAPADAPAAEPQPAPSLPNPANLDSQAASHTTTQPTPPHPPAPTPGPAATEHERLLKQILAELRAAHGQRDDVSVWRMAAIVLQALAIVSILSALWLGAGDVELFSRWMAAALIAQGATIAALLFDR